MNIYERYGRKQEQLELMHESYTKTLELLARLQDGEIRLEEVVVSPEGWHLVAVEEREVIPTPEQAAAGMTSEYLANKLKIAEAVNE